MITVAIWKGGNHAIREFPDDRRVVISRLGSADICLPDDYVSAPHAFLEKRGGRLFLEAVGTNPTYLDDQWIKDETPVAVPPGAIIAIRGFKIEFVEARATLQNRVDMVLQRVAGHETELFNRTFEAIDFRNIPLLPNETTQEGCDILRTSFEPVFRARSEAIYGDSGVCRALLARLFLRLVLERTATAEERNVTRILGAGGKGQVALPLQVFVRDPDVHRVVTELIEGIESARDDRVQSGERVSSAEAALDAWESLSETLEGRISPQKARDLIREELFRRVVNLSFELGPLEDLLALPGATEILCVGHDRIFIELNGKLRESSDRFPSDAAGRRVLERAVSRAGRRIDVSQPLVDVALPDGSRLNAVIPPLARGVDVLSIRRFRPVPYTLEDLEQRATFSRQIARFLAAVVVARRNVVVSGGTGSGKTTLLGALVSHVGPKERIVLIEDTAEIRTPPGLHVVSLQSRHANVEGKGEVTIRALVRNALRMRPDRLIVGECRGPEVIDMLQAMNTGHPGSLTTIHANSPDEVASRIETMALQGIDLPIGALRRQIADSIDVVIHLEKRGGERRVTVVSEVVGFDDRRQALDVVPIFVSDPTSDDGILRFSGWLPTFSDALRSQAGFDEEDFVD
jgi:Flp pilus assembly CpaF family ATPase